jgi:predicted RNA-binding Zn-ribbon protein involved in translation (DUF1610 family)
MPRPKGSKNILNAKQLKAEIERLKNGAKAESPEVQNPEVSLPDNPIKTSVDTKSQNINASDIKIKVPKKQAIKQKSVNDITKSFGCGNRLCDYESDTKFNTCPKCGVNNTWRSDTNES